MEQIVCQLSDVGFPCEKFDESYFIQAFNIGANKNFIFIVRWIGNEISKLCSIEKQFSSLHDEKEYELEPVVFYIDLSSFLQELGCPFKVLATGSLIDRYDEAKRKELLVSYLCTEFKATKMNFSKRPAQNPEYSESKLKEPYLSVQNLIKLFSELNCSDTEDFKESQHVFQNIVNKIKILITSNILEKPNTGLLFTDRMTEAQWSTLEALYEEMLQEYEIRRGLMLVRSELTLKSFIWKYNSQFNDEDPMKLYLNELKSVDSKPSVKITDILVADVDLLCKHPSYKQNENRTIYKTLIGNVPDRGGRPECHQSPPAELPTWQKNRHVDQRELGHAATKNKSLNFNKTQSQGFSYKDRKKERQTAYHQQTSSPYFHQDLTNDHYFGFSHRIPAGDNFYQYSSSEPMAQFRGRGRPYRRYQGRH